MSFGFSVGDFIAVGQFAWRLYKSCKGAPESFDNIHVELLSFHAVLKEVEETVLPRPGTDERQMRLARVVDGCRTVLDDLEKLVNKYEVLPIKTKKTWTRMRWGFEDVANIRARLVSNSSMLTAFISTCQTSVEAKLDEILKEFRKGHREGSVISMQTVDSLCTADRKLWRSIRKELEEMGMPLAAFDANKDFIFTWLKRAMADGAFEEQANENEQDDVGSEPESGTSGSASTTRPASPDHVAFKRYKGSRYQAILKALSNTQKAQYPSQPLKSHLNKLLSWVTLKDPNQELIDALTHGDPKQALKLLRSQSSLQRWAKEGDTINLALRLAVQWGLEGLLEPLLVAGPVDINDQDLLTLAIDSAGPENKGSAVLYRLLELGADPCGFSGTCILRAIDVDHERALTVLLDAEIDVNARIANFDTLLHRAISMQASLSVVEIILEKDAKVNKTDSDGQTPLGVAIGAGRQEIVNLLIRNGADLEKQTLFANWFLGDANSVTPLIGAVKTHELSIAKLLVSKGADINKHHASPSVLDVIPREHTAQVNVYPNLLRVLGRASLSAVHAAVVHDIDIPETSTLGLLIQEGAHTNWDIALILAFLESISRANRDGVWIANYQGALVSVLEKCSESRGKPTKFLYVDSQVLPIMASCVYGTKYTEWSDGDSYLRSLVDDVISKCL